MIVQYAAGGDSELNETVCVSGGGVTVNDRPNVPT